MKTCTTCDTEKPFSEFYKGKRYKDGYTTKCKPCMSAFYKVRNARPEIKARARENSYRTKYGITVDQYNLMLQEQNYSCKICGSTDSKRGDQRFMVDHCHKTGEVRGLLCSQCNSALGLFEDNPQLLQSAINYLSTNV